MREKAERLLYILRHECSTKTYLKIGKRRIDAIVELMTALLKENERLKAENERLRG